MDLVERGRELTVTVPDEEPERADPVREVHDQIAGLLGRPYSVWVPGHPEDVHPPVATSMTNSTYKRRRKTVSTVKKSHASKPSA